MQIRQLVPEFETLDLSAWLASLARPYKRLQPFSPQVVEFCAGFSHRLFHDSETRAFPEVQALAFWMRKTELVRLRQQFGALETESTILVPRGTVFHVPPSNVETLFIYSWLLSILTGNRNIIRLPLKLSAQMQAICSVLNEALAAEASRNTIRRNTVIVAYGHETEVTAGISAISDVRMIWGGDETVRAIQSVPRSVHGRDVAFADRSSFSVIDAEQYLLLDDERRRPFMELFFNDAYSFEQRACSSPVLLVWRGPEACAAAASARFWPELSTMLRARRHVVEAGPALQKMTYAYQAVLDVPVNRYQSFGNELTVLTLEEAHAVPRRHSGSGLFFEARVDRLSDIERFVVPRHQSITYFGFSSAELYDVVRRLNGCGVDRIVPVGQALTFNRFWDGMDLLQELTRRVYVEQTAS